MRKGISHLYLPVRSTSVSLLWNGAEHACVLLIAKDYKPLTLRRAHPDMHLCMQLTEPALKHAARPAGSQARYSR